MAINQKYHVVNALIRYFLDFFPNSGLSFDWKKNLGKRHLIKNSRRVVSV